MKLYIITPYEAMIGVIKQTIAQFPDFDIQFGVGDLEKGVELAHVAKKNGFDVIISRGGTAQMINKQVNIPVIDMGLSGYDLLKTIIMANNQSEKTALVGFSNITTGAYAIIDLLDISIEIYMIENAESLDSLLIQLKEEGFSYIIGDVITTKKANDLNFSTILLQAGEETIKTAIEQASFMIKQVDREQSKNLLIGKGFRLIHNNYLLVQNNEIIESHLNDFVSNPLNTDQIRSLLYEVSNNSDSTHFYFKDKNLVVEIFVYEYMQEKVYLLLMKPTKGTKKTIPGVGEYYLNPSYNLVIESTAMQELTEQLKTYVQRKNIICLIGEDEVTRDHLIQYVYNELNRQGPILALDFSHVSLEHISGINWKQYYLIKIDNIQDSSQLQELLDFTRDEDVYLFLTVRNHQQYTSVLNDHQVVPINLPNFKERIADSLKIANHLIGYYHNNIGTKPIKMNKEMNQALIDLYSFETMDEYVGLIKEALFREVNYTLSLETVSTTFEQRAGQSTELFESTNLTLEEIELKYIELVLEEENFNQTKAAERLGISRSTLWRKLQSK